jgi:hypothetical protein
MISEENNSSKILYENSIKTIHYESFDDWIKNFSLNLTNIWNESSAKILEQPDDKFSTIVIGRGPSIDEKSHLKLLADSNYDGNIICCDGKLIDALKSGVTPDKFSKFYVATIDPHPKIADFYNHDIVKNYGSKINGLFSTITHPDVVKTARDSGIKIHWFHSLFDYNEGKKSFNYISSKMVRAKNHINGLPGIQTGGNIGTSSWFIGWKILKSNVICLIGINHGWNESDSWETIVSHGRKDLIKNIDPNDPTIRKLFKKVYNPFFNCFCILDPLFQFYSTALKEFISRSPKSVHTINATEGGSIFGTNIDCMTFKDFLKNHSC